MSGAEDRRAHAPATLRNRAAILAVLSRFLPPAGLVLELASGSGEHAAFFAAALPGIVWQPTDLNPRALASIAAYRAAENLPNLLPPLTLDASSPDWPIAAPDAVVCINMIHIAPWAATEGLIVGAGRILPTDGILYLYGPFTENGAHNADSNRMFDADLRSRNPLWGVRDLGKVIALAERRGLLHLETVDMPANNRSVIFKKNGE